jgi:fluoride ion exporter CrcB/FEX
MNHKLQRAFVYFDYLIATVFAIYGLYLITAPLHPSSSNSHNGLMAIFPGILLLTFATFSFAAGKLLQRNHRLRWSMQIINLALVAIIAFLALS